MNFTSVFVHTRFRFLVLLISSSVTFDLVSFDIWLCISEKWKYQIVYFWQFFFILKTDLSDIKIAN